MILISLLLSAARADWICTGDAKAQSPWGRLSVRAIVEVTGCGQSLVQGREGRVTIDIGGEPVTYEGPVTLDGRTPHRVSHAPSGDYALFTLTQRENMDIKIRINEYNRDQDKLGYVLSAWLKCLPQP